MTINTNFLQVIKDSQFFTDIDELITTIEIGICNPETFDIMEFLIGLKNTKDRGYNINKDDYK